MRIRVRGAAPELTDGLRGKIERRLRFILARFDRQIDSATLVVQDRIGAQDSQDRGCSLEIDLVPPGRIAVEVTDRDLYAAVSWAAELAGRAVGRELARRRLT